MRKFLLASLVVFVTHSVYAGWTYGTSNECIWSYNANKARREFRYCGGGQSSCAGTKQRKLANVELLTHGMIWHENGSWHVCCNGTSTSQGTFEFLDTKKFLPTDGQRSIPTIKETITVDLEGGGRCTYEQKYDACGKTYNKVCTEPTSCTDGLILRNGKCIEPCAEGSEFESVTSNSCVECDTTMYQGPARKTEEEIKADLKTANIFVKSDGTFDETKTNNAAAAQKDQYYCLKCDKDTEFYDKEGNKCIKKSGMLKGTAQEMSQCGLCVNNLIMADCIKCFAGIGEDTNSSSEGCQDDYEDDCFFQDKQNTKTE